LNRSAASKPHERQALYYRLKYELPAEPTRDQITELTKKLCSIEDKLMNDWENATKDDEAQTLTLDAAQSGG
jgi:hypothetical protein